MIVLLSALIGAIVGATIAKRRKGALLDILQYAAVYAIAFCLLGLFGTIILERTLG